MCKKVSQANIELRPQHRAANPAVGHPSAEPLDIQPSPLVVQVDNYNIQGLIIYICQDLEDITRSAIHIDLGTSLLQTSSGEGWTNLLDFRKLLDIAQEAGVNLQTEELWADTLMIMPIRNVGLLKYVI